MIKELCIAFTILIALTLGALDPTSPDYCTWLARTQIPSGVDASTVKCVDKCHKICTDNPGEYLCSGYKVHTDTAENKYDDTTANMFTYCLCSRSVIKRDPGKYCGPKNTLCAGLMTSQQIIGFVEGQNNSIPDYQGTVVYDLAEKQASGVFDNDVPCNNTLHSMMRYLFQ